MRTARTGSGILTSGNFSPMRERGIGLGFVDADARLLDGDEVTVVQRGRELPAHVWSVRPCGRSARRPNSAARAGRAGRGAVPYSGSHN